MARALTSHQQQALDTILEDGFAPGSTHHLVLGPRGTGKTTVLDALAARLEDVEGQDGLRWVQLYDSYTIESPEALWRRVDAALGERPEQLVLLVDDIDRMLDDWSEQQAWALRSGPMSQQEGLILICTATDSSFHEGAESPFLDFMRVSRLDRLEEDELAAFVKARRPDFSDVRTRWLDHWSQGSLRRLTVGCRVLTEQGTPSQDLVDLLRATEREHQLRLDNLSTQQRRVLTALGVLWRPSRMSEVAAHIEASRASCNTQMLRLIDLGLAFRRQNAPEPDTGRPSKRTSYGIRDPLLTACLLWRRRGLAWTTLCEVLDGGDLPPDIVSPPTALGLHLPAEFRVVLAS